MHVRIRGSRGSVPSPGADSLRYGGNTSCVEVALSDGTYLILDAGTGLRNVPAELATSGGHVHVLLTHLHLDHIQGLLFFSPLFEQQAQITIWGPSAPGVSLKDRLATTSPRCSGRSRISNLNGSRGTRWLTMPPCSYTTASTPTRSTRRTMAGATRRSHRPSASPTAATRLARSCFTTIPGTPTISSTLRGTRLLGVGNSWATARMALRWPPRAMS